MPAYWVGTFEWIMRRINILTCDQTTWEVASYSRPFITNVFPMNGLGTRLHDRRSGYDAWLSELCIFLKNNHAHWTTF